MPNNAITPTGPVVVLVNVCFIASLAIWLIVARRWKRGEVLAYEERRPVPWGPIGAFLATALVLLVVGSALAGDTPAVAPDAPAPTSSQAFQRLLAHISFQALLVGGFLVAVALLSRATWRDLGLPANATQFVGDVGLGLAACIASLIPVYGVLSILVLVYGQPPHHPLIETLSRDFGPTTVLLGIIAAVVVAPICEEVAFRLLLQGWLEKRQGQMTNEDRQMTNDECLMTNEEGQVASSENEISANSSFVIRHSSFPLNWLPIIISATMFAVAHLGQGPAPIALFILAVILGYVYRQTHRIVPCIVTHAMFNLLNLAVLWLSMKGPAE
jgi:membrane protease YdiL (CAAX protease family)